MCLYTLRQENNYAVNWYKMLSLLEWKTSVKISDSIIVTFYRVYCTYIICIHIVHFVCVTVSVVLSFRIKYAVIVKIVKRVSETRAQ